MDFDLLLIKFLENIFRNLLTNGFVCDILPIEIVRGVQNSVRRVPAKFDESRNKWKTILVTGCVTSTESSCHVR